MVTQLQLRSSTIFCLWLLHQHFIVAVSSTLHRREVCEHHHHPRGLGEEEGEEEAPSSNDDGMGGGRIFWTTEVEAWQVSLVCQR